MRAIEDESYMFSFRWMVHFGLFVLGLVILFCLRCYPVRVPGTNIDADIAYLLIVAIAGLAYAIVSGINKVDLRSAIACGQYKKAEVVLRQQIAGYKRQRSLDVYRIQNLIDLATICFVGGKVMDAERLCRDALDYAQASVRAQQAMLQGDEPTHEYGSRLICEAGLRTNILKISEASCLIGEILAHAGKYEDAQAIIATGLSALKPFEVYLHTITSQEEQPGGERTYREVPFEIALDFQKIDAYELREAYYSRKSKLLRLSARVHELAGERQKAQSNGTDARSAEWKWLEAAEGLVKEQANFPEMFLKVADCNITMERYESAIQALDKALDLAPSRECLYEILLKRADCLCRRGELDRALDDVEKVLKMVPDSTLALLSRAEINESRGMKDKALVDRQKAESLGVQRRYTELA
ncbi:MAG: tetratricopeptide repeat protein [Cyanobacteriota/Melainabacteria group bacterium]